VRALPSKATVARRFTYGPEALEAIAGQLEAEYRDAEQQLLRLLAQGHITDWRRAFTTQQLSQVRAILDALTGTAEEWCRFHVPTLYKAGLAVVESHLQPGGLSHFAHPGEITPMDLGMTRLDHEAVAMLVENASLRLGEANSYCGQWIESMIARAKRTAQLYGSAAKAMAVQQAIRDATLKTMIEAFAKGATRQEASKAFLAALRKRGVTCFIDRSGRQWPMRQYAEMVARTVAQEAQRHGIQNRMMQSGHDLVEVSDHADECPRCKPWEGRILSLTGRTKGYPTVDDAYAAGLFHPRCAHVTLPYIRG